MFYDEEAVEVLRGVNIVIIRIWEPPISTLTHFEW